jgi:hypothetical protein
LAALLLATLGLGSCYKDKSTNASIEVPNISRANLTVANSVFFEYLAEVDWAPELAFYSKERPTSDDFIRVLNEAEYDAYNYLWTITVSTENNDNRTRVLSEERRLQTVMSSLPNLNTYDLTLFMSHKQTGMVHEIHWRVTVSEALFGPGVIVADTRDGVTSDLSLIRGYHYKNKTAADTAFWDSEGFPKPEGQIVLRNAYSAANGATVDGLVNSIAFNRKTVVNYPEKNYNSAGIIDFTVRGEHLIRVNPRNFEELARDADLFYFMPSTWNPQQVYTQYYRDAYTRMLLTNDGRICNSITSSDAGYYMLDMLSDYNFDINPDAYVSANITGALGLYFDRRAGKIIRFEGNFGANVGLADILGPYPDVFGEGPFSHLELSGVDCLYAGLLRHNQPGWQSMWLMKDKTTGGLYLYQFQHHNGNPIPPTNSYLLVGQGIAIFDLSQCVGLADATCYMNSLTQGEFYYAVGNEIRVAVCNQASGVMTPVSKTVFTFDPAEKITHMQWYISQTGQTFFEMNADEKPRMVTSMNNLCTVATYNESTGEGKVYAIPRKYAGSGDFLDVPNPSSEFVSQWGGFGRITAITTRE